MVVRISSSLMVMSVTYRPFSSAAYSSAVLFSSRIVVLVVFMACSSLFLLLVFARSGVLVSVAR